MRALKKAAMSGGSGLETRRLHSLARKKAVNGRTVHAEDAAHSNGIEPPVMDQPPNRLGVDAELARYLADAHQVTRISPYRRHNLQQLCQVRGPFAGVNRRKGPIAPT
jgi:hypothetical protein